MLLTSSVLKLKTRLPLTCFSLDGVPSSEE